MFQFNNRMSQLFAATDTIYIDSVLLVREVEKHPIIYDSAIRRDQFAICHAWEDIVTSLIPQYPSLNEDDQRTIRNNMRKRWSWMRCTLQRDLYRNKPDTHKHLNWMQELMFMVPVIAQNRKAVYLKKLRLEECRRKASESPNTSKVTSTTTSDVTFHSNFYRSPSPSQETFQSLPSSSYCIQHVRQDGYIANEKLVDLFIFEFRSEVFTTSMDRDIHFLYTLLHTFRKLSPEQKVLRKQKFDSILQV